MYITEQGSGVVGLAGIVTQKVGIQCLYDPCFYACKIS